MVVEINDKLYCEIENFCELNNIDNVTTYINKILKNQFTIDVYGVKPNIYLTSFEKNSIINKYEIKIDDFNNKGEDKVDISSNKKYKKTKKETYLKKNDVLFVDNQNKDVYLQIENEEKEDFKFNKPLKSKLR